jgi:hypothetical protein
VQVAQTQYATEVRRPRLLVLARAVCKDLQGLAGGGYGTKYVTKVRTHDGTLPSEDPSLKLEPPPPALQGPEVGPRAD